MSKATYQAAYRRAVPENYERDKAYARAKSRAYRQLSDQYPQMFEAILRYEYALEGYELTGVMPGHKKTKRGLTYKDSV